MCRIVLEFRVEGSKKKKDATENCRLSYTDNMSCLHNFMTGEIIATHEELTMLAPSC